MRCERGFCIVCDKEIMTKCGSCNKFDRANGQATEVLMNWSNGSRMSIGVCIECAPEKIWKADKQVLTQAVWDAWDKMGHKYSKEIVIVE